MIKVDFVSRFERNMGLNEGELKEVLKVLTEKRIYRKRLTELRNSVSLFAPVPPLLLENENIAAMRQTLLGLIDNIQGNASPEEFKASLNNTKHKAMLSDYSIQELSQMKLFKVEGYDAGFALKKMDNGSFDIVSVHNNTGIPGLGEALMSASIKNGGCYLDHFDTDVLRGLYDKMGFIELSRDEYNPEYDESQAIKNHYGGVDVVYRVHKTCQVPAAADV